jgi:hypothetical protein
MDDAVMGRDTARGSRWKQKGQVPLQQFDKRMRRTRYFATWPDKVSIAVRVLCETGE